MGYDTALRVAGATVHKMEMYGDYQGSWFALVTDDAGNKGWLTGTYGSCSGCDHFEAEFTYEGHSHDEHGGPLDRWSVGYRKVDAWQDEPEFVEGCAKCADLKDRLFVFGREYLREGVKSLDAIVQSLVIDRYCSGDDEEFVNAHYDELLPETKALVDEYRREK